jgi:DNA replicative helicase MCM subunit Mcm2 (Cdc46/Mcm family)
MIEHKKLFKQLRKIRDSIDDLMVDITEDIAREVVEEIAQKREFDAIAVGKSKIQVEHTKSIRDIVKEIERETGSAPLQEIVDRAKPLGFGGADVEAELTRLVQAAAIFEPVRYSGNYRLTQE